MKINYQWLQSYIDQKLPEPEVLTEKIIFGAFEVEDVEKAENGDAILDIKILPDRAHDCLSHYGMAREVAGLLGLTLKPLEFRTHEAADSDIKVSIQTDMCRRYIARKFFGVTVKPSPDWLRERLESIGQRSINNIVDATNYVMFSLGQPMHAFDYDKMANGNIVVRNAHKDEPITTLDGKILALDESMGVVADERHALAIAGVKGGNIAEVTAETKNIVIEVANFDPISVRKTAKKLNLQTDSLKRFENELTAHLAGTAIHAITDLIVDVAGGQPESPVDEYKDVVTQKTVVFAVDYINKVLGTNISISEVADILNRYGYSFKEEVGSFELLVPYERIDITGPHDMAEEIGRVYGYEKITPELPKIDFTPKINETFAKICAVKADLVSKGYSEVQTYTFCKKGDFEVARGAVGKSALRTNLKDGLAESYALNKQNVGLLGLDEVKIFEVGTVFPKSGEEMHVAFANNKKGGVEITEMTLDEYVENESSLFVANWKTEYAFPGAGEGAVKPFKMWSEYPYMTRDIAVWIPEGESSEELAVILREYSQDLRVNEPRLFDQFSKDGKTSYAYRIVFQSFERTLTDEEVNKIMENITEKVKEKGWEVR